MAIAHPDRFEQFLSWARYLHWSDVLYLRWMPDEDDQGAASGRDNSLLFALTSQWLASVWVVIEGWRELRLSDPVIENLLNAYPDYCELLRRFRNGVYHFQREIFDEHLTLFAGNGQETWVWVVALFYEFKRYYWEWPDKHVGADHEKTELRAEVHQLIGWMPFDILHARDHELRKLQRQAERYLAERKDHSSPEAQGLVEAIAHGKGVLEGLEKSPWLNGLTRLNPGQ